MNDLQKELNALKEKIADLESRIVVEPVKWQPKGGDWYIVNGGGVVKLATSSESREFGSERATKEQAERASVEMRRFNRLLALRDELCGDEVVDWTNDSLKYQVFFSHASELWYFQVDTFGETIAPYFTSGELAQKACDMLNSGEVEL